MGSADPAAHCNQARGTDASAASSTHRSPACRKGRLRIDVIVPFAES